MNTISSPDIVIVGGGPIGLWTAIQTKFLTGRRVLVVEKYLDYKRADIHLNISGSSFAGIPHCAPLKDLVKKWKNQLVPIKNLETELAKCAHKVGVAILKGKWIEPAKLQEEFPTARVFIGADGARSAMRKELFDDQYKFNTPLQYLLQVQYKIKTPANERIEHKSQRAMDHYRKQKFAGHFITQQVRAEANGQSQVTLRIFIDEKTYRQMADANYKTPYYFEQDLGKVPAQVRNILIKWWGAQKDHALITDLEKTNKITVVPLVSYAAKEVVKTIEKRGDSKERIIVALVGDASQGYPFFRAINNGFLLGTRLAQCTHKAFEALAKAKPEEASSHFKSFSQYSSKRAYIERIRAYIKNLFIVFARLWITASGLVPWQTVKLNKKEQYESYQRGAAIWEKLSGVTPPPFRQKHLDLMRSMIEDVKVKPF